MPRLETSLLILALLGGGLPLGGPVQAADDQATVNPTWDPLLI